MREMHDNSLRNRGNKEETRRYGKASLITAGVLIGQVSVVLYSESLTLSADSIHVGSDLTVMIGSLVISLLVLGHSAAREEKVRRQFAYVGIALLVAGAFYVFAEANERMQNPVFHPTLWVPAVATLGGAGNLWVHMMFRKVPEKEHNHTHTVLSVHVLSDLILSIVVVVSWGLTFAFEWVQADPILSALVAGYMLFLAGRLFEKVHHKKVPNR